MQEEMTIRRCTSCKKLLNFKPDGTQEGVLCCDEYYHEGKCLEKSFEGQTHSAWAVINNDKSWGCTDCEFETTDQQEAIEHYKTPLTWDEHYHEDGDCYYTEWNPEILEQVNAS